VTEFISVVSRVVGYLSLAWLIGGAAFLLSSRPSADPLLRAYRSRVSRSFLWAISICVLATVTGLIAQTLATVDWSFERAIDALDWMSRFALQTRYGHVALLKLSLLPLLLAPAVLLVKAKLPRPESVAAELLLILSSGSGLGGRR
jgi:putative copper export protein